MRAALLALGLMLPVAAAAATLEPSRTPLDPALSRDGWQLHGVAGRMTARFAAQPDGTIAVAAERAVAFLVRPLPDPERAHSLQPLHWRWRVDAAPPPTDLARADGDDRPLAVHVIFPAPRGEGWFGRLRRSLVAAVAGDLFAGRVLSYVWGGTAPAGTLVPNPYLPDDAVLIVRRGADAPLGVWMDETVDVAADYRTAFGRPPSDPPTAIAISSDTDDRGGTARAQIVPPRIGAP
ncbi:MAG: DUF3047 domain-containing protein [Proteobacteria bacterium]|nr:DUF3047 domain-containing protein [Pseudomonadota bacterium]